MGCAESLPAESEYAVRHKIDPSIPSLRSFALHGANQSPQRLVVKGKCDFLTERSPLEVQTCDGKPFGTGLVLNQGSDSQIVLRDCDGSLIAVCMRKVDPSGETFKIYSVNPFYKGQKETKNQHCSEDGIPLYAYAVVKRFWFRTVFEIKYATEWGPTFTVNRAGSAHPVKRTVRNMRNGEQMAAFMKEEETPSDGGAEGEHNSFSLHVNPGIDPYLMVCVMAVCKKLS